MYYYYYYYTASCVTITRNARRDCIFTRLLKLVRMVRYIRIFRPSCVRALDEMPTCFTRLYVGPKPATSVRQLLQTKTIIIIIIWYYIVIYHAHIMDTIYLYCIMNVNICTRRATMLRECSVCSSYISQMSLHCSIFFDNAPS